MLRIAPQIRMLLICVILLAVHGSLFAFEFESTSIAKDFEGSYQLGRQNTHLVHTSPLYPSSNHLDDQQSLDFLGHKNPHLQILPLATGFMAYLGNEIGDMVLQEVAQEKPIDNRTPMYSASYNPQTPSWHPTLAWEQNDYNSYYTGAYRRALLHSHYQGDRPLFFSDWNLPDQSWWQFGLKNLPWKSLNLGYRFGYFWQKDLASGVESAYRMHQYAGALNWTPRMHTQFSLQQGRRLFWNSHPAQTLNDDHFTIANLRWFHTIRLIPGTPVLQGGAAIRIVDGLEDEYHRFVPTVFFHYQPDKKYRDLFLWQHPLYSINQEYQPGVIFGPDFYEMRIDAPARSRSGWAQRIRASANYGYNPNLPYKNRTVFSNKSDTSFYAFQKRFHSQRLAYSFLYTLKDKSQTFFWDNGIRTWTHHKPTHFQTDSVWNMHGFLHRIGHYDYSEKWNFGVDLKSRVFWKPTSWLKFNLKGSTYLNHLEKARDITPPKWDLQLGAKLKFPTQLDIDLQAFKRAEYQIHNWGKDFAVNEDWQVNLSVEQYFVQRQMKIFVTLMNLLANEHPWYPGSAEHRFRMHFGIQYHFSPPKITVNGV